MKILVLNYEFPPIGGGASPVSYDIAKRYAMEGYKVDVVTMNYKDLPEFEIIEGINIYRVKCIRTKKEICYPWEQLSYLISAKLFLKNHLRENKYDVCHAHFLIPTGVLALGLKKKYKLPYIITAHGSDVPGHNPDRFKVAHKFTKPIISKVCQNAKFVIAPSEYLANEIKINILIKNIKLRIIQNGIDENIFPPIDKKKIILSSGRMHPGKGFQYLIRAVCSIKTDYELHICGDGPMMKKLKKLAKNSKTKVIFHGWIDNKSEKYKYLLGSASIFVLTSEKETASLSIIEAMASKCAIITSDVSGCAETIGDAGIKIKPKNFKEINKNIKILINDPKLAKYYGELAYSRFFDIFTLGKNANNYIKLLNE